MYGSRWKMPEKEKKKRTSQKPKSYKGKHSGCNNDYDKIISTYNKRRKYLGEK